MGWVATIIAGIILGLLGKFIAPGDKDNIPIWLTIIVGIVGALLGYWIAGALGVQNTKGFDWLRWIISLIVSIVLVMVTSTILGRRGRAVGR